MRGGFEARDEAGDDFERPRVVVARRCHPLPRKFLAPIVECNGLDLGATEVDTDTH